MADQSSFDVVSEVNMQEMKNVVDQATKEIKQRFDFKDSKTELTLKEKEKRTRRAFRRRVQTQCRQ